MPRNDQQIKVSGLVLARKENETKHKQIEGGRGKVYWAGL